MITMRATALSQISASFRIAEANVVSGTKNTNACRITTSAKSEMASPAHVARDTFVRNRRLIGRETERRADVVCFHGFSIKMPRSSSLDSREYQTV